MKIIETRPREIGFVLWGHYQNLLDDPVVDEEMEDPRANSVPTLKLCDFPGDTVEHY